ncbi:MAG TPA: HNH endonuclease [Chloroflexia bacterium]|nr:HNH endonuclease [Chloroflexia bacterium]
MAVSYLDRFARLRMNQNTTHWTATTCYRAPHKPFLLLAVMDLIAEGVIASNLIELTPDLGELFTLYWARVMPPGQRGNLFMPFFHLTSDQFWHLVPQPGQEAMLTATRQIASASQLRELVLGARLDDALFALLATADSRNALRMVLIETYFAPEVQTTLREQGTINAEAFSYSQLLLDQARIVPHTPMIREAALARPVVRDQGFRRAIVTAYTHRCALCGIRMVTPEGHSVVDAAHIVPWSVTYDDNPRNGLALCRLCHWTFDEGLVGVSANYLVLASPQLVANHNIPSYLSTLTNRIIIGPAEQFLWPDLESLSWHRRNVFRTR